MAYLFKSIMKHIYLFLLIVGLYSCKQVAVKEEIAIALPTQRFIADFKKKHAEWQNNEVIEKKTNGLFAKQLDSFLRTDSALKGVNFKLQGTNKYEKGKYAVKLVNVDLSDSLNMEIIGLCPEELIGKLIDEKVYSISGSYIKRLNELTPYYDYGMWNINVGSQKLVSEGKVYFG